MTSPLSLCKNGKQHHWFVSKTKSIDPESEATVPDQMTCFSCNISIPYDQGEYYHWNEPDWKPPKWS